MAVYSIKDLEKLSGIKAHTLRIWEQRYNIIQPKRTQTNIRYFEDDDLKLVLNIAMLNRNGIKISKIAKMSRDEIGQKVATISDINFEHGTQLDALTIAMMEMDEFKFDRIVSTNIQQLGFEYTMLEVIYPFLEKLSLLWLTGSINAAQENFISYLVRQKIIVAIDKEPLSIGPGHKKFIIYLPEGDKQELSLLFMHYLLKLRRNHVIYLGQDISLEDLQDAYAIHHPDYIFTMITEPFAKGSVQQYSDKLAICFPKAQILLSGYQVVAQKVSPAHNNIFILRSLSQTLHFLDQINTEVLNGSYLNGK